jgi:hypothetical protein
MSHLASLALTTALGVAGLALSAAAGACPAGGGGFRPLGALTTVSYDPVRFRRYEYRYHRHHYERYDRVHHRWC